MAGPTPRVDKAEEEAAAWHGRLGRRVVSTDTIEAFFAWRADPVNAEAYQRIEALWGRAGGVASDPDILAARHAANHRRAVQRRSPMVWGAALAGAAAVVLVVGWTWWDGRGVFETGIGEDRLIRLAEGSTVRLDTGSRVRVRFDGRRRWIDLQSGQALFTVAHDASRPFVVRAGGAEVTALGTVFDVRREGETVSVALVSGKVEVSAGTGAVRLDAGEKAEVAGGRASETRFDAETELGWTQGRLVFRETPLGEAVAEVNRYLPEPIVLVAPGVAGTAVNGVFVTGDGEAFVAAAETLFGLRREVGPDGSVRLVAKK